jgi:Glucodextranase, domain B
VCNAFSAKQKKGFSMLPLVRKWPPRVATSGRAQLLISLLLLTASGFWSGSVRAGTGLTGFTVDPGPPASAPASHGLLPVSTQKNLVVPAGSEVCGIDSIFADGLEALSFLPIGQSIGGIASPGLTQDITGTGTLSVTVASPVNGATTGDGTVDVTGTFVGPVNTGIAVNGIAGYTTGGQFLIPNVPLTSGANTLNLTATILPGATATNTVSLTQSGTATPIVVATSRPVGYAPFAENFTYTIGTLPGNAAINSVAINFRGIGGNDYSGPFAGAPTSYNYQQPGLYIAQFQFTDSNNVVYTIKKSVLIQDFGAQHAMLCDVYGYLRDRLTAQDATNAGNAFQPAVRNDFIAYFTGLGSNMPSTAQQLGVIVDGQLGFGFADLLLVRDNADQTRSGFPLRLTLGTDGVWRISEM